MATEEEQVILLLLNSRRHESQKLGLIRLCERLQAGFHPHGRRNIIAILKLHIFGTDNELERWSLKIVAELRDISFEETIAARLRTPPRDAENLAWAIIAYFAVANEEQIELAYQRGLIAKDWRALLAYELTEMPGQMPRDFPRIRIENADPVTLKCACVCVATGRNKRDVFEPKFKQPEQLVALNGHHCADVVQYSVYAMFRSKTLRYKHMEIRGRDINKQPPDVQKWIMRLLTKRQIDAVENRELIEAVARGNAATAAEEGLALGLRNIWYDGLDVVTFNWLDNGPDERVEQAVLEHMAAQSDKSKDYSERVKCIYRDEASNLLKARIKDAALGTALFGKLQAVDELTHGQTTFFVGGDVNMKNFNQNFSGGNVSIGTNTVDGNSVGNQVNQQIFINEEVRRLVGRIREIAESDPKANHASELGSVLKELEAAPSTSKLRLALETTKNWMGAAALSAEAMSLAKDFVDAVTNILGS